ncbi:MAG: ABC transporter ATP-binding protein [Thaumarchaeota archaeon]|nr:ABC transporter ATP-binding protein [Candidatus Calditenuaceae archaeon]MDW8041927.1 ABC transporter ATP-binding protein [Nitrososphaerota archaeon]
MLELRGVVAGYGRLPIITGIDVSIRRGETVAIIGPNGSGKSTLAKTVVGLTNVFEGTIIYDGHEITHRPPSERVRLGIAYLPQTGNVFPDMTVLENLEMGGYSLSRDELKVKLQEVLEMFPELSGRLKQKAGTLSGGERQMLAMSRLLMTSPSLVIMDEPSAGLAPKMVHRIFEKVDALRKVGLTLLLIEQHARMAISHSERTLVMVGGKVVLSDSSDRVSGLDLATVFFQRA